MLLHKYTDKWRSCDLSRWRRITVNTVGISFVSLLLLSILLTLPLRWLNPPTTAFMLADPFLNTDTQRQWIRAGDVSQEVLFAIVSAEDQHFFNHWGFDIASIKQSLQAQRSRRRGASTISQQLTKNLYLWPERSYFRKALEAWLTLCLETFVSKQRLLEIYINIVEFGKGIYGVEHASNKFFNKPSSELSRVEASLLAAVLPNPKNYSAIKPSAYVQRRAKEIRRWIPDMQQLYSDDWP